MLYLTYEELTPSSFTQIAESSALYLTYEELTPSAILSLKRVANSHILSKVIVVPYL